VILSHLFPHWLLIQSKLVELSHAFSSHPEQTGGACAQPTASAEWRASIKDRGCVAGFSHQPLQMARKPRRQASTTGSACIWQGSRGGFLVTHACTMELVRRIPAPCRRPKSYLFRSNGDNGPLAWPWPMDAGTLHLREGGGEAEAGEFKGGQLEGEAMAVACEQQW